MIPTSLDRTLMALADPTRRAILRRLSRGEARVTDIAKPFAMSLNAVSKHILVLEKAHLVRRHRRGREHLLSVNPEPLSAVMGWIDGHRRMWEEKLDRLNDYLLTGQENGTNQARSVKNQTKSHHHHNHR